MRNWLSPASGNGAVMIKVCGIRSRSEADMVVEAGADAVGFVFHEASRRRAEPHAVAPSAPWPAAVARVGVFVNASVSAIVDAAQVAQLTTIQLHGSETAETCAQLAALTGCAMVKALRVRSRDDLDDIARYDTDFILLDGWDGATPGGSGRCFDWTLLEGAVACRERLILAGGLATGNVGCALSMANPMGVDVSTGVEEAGRKERTKITEFVAAVRGWEARAC